MRSPADPPSAARLPLPVPVTFPITLGQFLKVAGLASTGGEAKYLIVSGQVRVNGQGELRRGRHLEAGDVIEMSDYLVTVTADDSHRPQ